VDDPGKRAAIYVSLHRGENYPALDVQLTESVRRAREQGLGVVRVYGDVAGTLNATRRRQIARLFGLLRTETVPAAIGFVTTDPADRAFLGQQARAHGFSLAAGPKHVTVTTPWEDATEGGP
jgi:hypothetical protein